MSNAPVRKQLPTLPEGLFATILERPDGSPMRLIATGRRHRPVGSYYSVKNGAAVAWESRNELHAFYHAEVSTDVVGYRAQPHTLEIVEEGIAHRYTPDLEQRLDNGLIEIVEIKDSAPASDSEYAEKLAKAARIYKRLGWTFRVVERVELEAAPRFQAVEAIQSYRRTAVTVSDVLAVRQLFASIDSVSLGQMKALFANSVVGMAKAYAMVARRIVSIDHHAGLSDQTQVRLVNAGSARSA